MEILCSILNEPPGTRAHSALTPEARLAQGSVFYVHSVGAEGYSRRNQRKGFLQSGAKFIQSIAGGLTESFVPESVVKWGIFKPMTARRPL